MYGWKWGGGGKAMKGVHQNKNIGRSKEKRNARSYVAQAYLLSGNCIGGGGGSKDNYGMG